MFRLLKILLFIMLISIFSFNLCYAIDENITNDILSNQNATPTSENTVNNENINALMEEETYSTSTTISSASNMSNNSTVTNILLIALIVIGILLILLAIAILIRLGK